MKDKIDYAGAISLIGFSGLLGINQALIKITNEGIDPIFSAGIRSLIAMLFLLVWMIVSRKPIEIKAGTTLLGILTGLIFALEFLLLYIALDLTTVVRSSIIFYSMPVWLSIISHFWFRNDKLTKIKSLGLILSVTGVTWAILSNSYSTGYGNIIGDLLALAASILWALIAIISKGTKFSTLSAEMQLLWMLAISFPVLTLLSLSSDSLLRDFKDYHAMILLFQSSIVVAGGFVFWFWLLSIYPASGVASFAFLAPICGIFFGFIILKETINKSFLFSALLVIVGIFLVNYNRKRT